MSKSSAIGLAALLGTENPLGFALLGDIVSNWSDRLEIIEFQVSGTFDPANYKDALGYFIECWAGGASGRASCISYSGGVGCGGPGGNYANGLVLASQILSVVSVTVGAGGASVVANSGDSQVNGLYGGDTTFGSYVKAKQGIPPLSTGERDYRISIADTALVDQGIQYFSSDVRPAGAKPWPWDVTGWTGGFGAPSGISSSPMNTRGGNSEYGGAGGAGAPTDAGIASNALKTAPGGISIYGGNGGDGAYRRSTSNNTAIATSGAFPGGGGGGARVDTGATNCQAVSGAGGSGLCKVGVIHG